MLVAADTGAGVIDPRSLAVPMARTASANQVKRTAPVPAGLSTMACPHTSHRIHQPPGGQVRHAT